MFPDKLRVNLFPDGRGIVSPLRLPLVEVFACLRVACRLHFWQNDPGLIRADAVTGGEMDTE